MRGDSYSADRFYCLYDVGAMDLTYALICTGAVFIIMFIRTALEDKILQKELPGYFQYAKEVEFRLFPGIW
jgi:protein-S-isoprenylcysteine O-methyltransferase Ste14